jgi:hypothetical protein
VAKGWPVAIRVSQDGRQVVLAGIGIDLRCSGDMHAKVNHARTVVCGTLHIHDTKRDAAGNATDQCDSGAVKFTAQR